MSLGICSNAKDDSLSSHVVALKCFFTRFKTLKDHSAVAVEGEMRIYFCFLFVCFLFFISMSHKDGLVLDGLWDIIHTLLSILLLQG